MKKRRVFTPVTLPIYCFIAAILCGAFLLHSDISLAQGEISWLDAIFTAGSAVCVTGLVVVDTGSFFSPFGQGVILVLIQIGGLGVMTYTSLVFYLWRRRVSLTDRIAVGQSLLNDPSFHLGRFLFLVVGGTIITELCGALFLLLFDHRGFSIGSALFHSVSAFCNAGFALQADSLMGWRNNLPVCLIFIALITLGGLGFSVLSEGGRFVRSLFCKDGLRAASWRLNPRRLSYHARTVLSVSLFLVLGGTIAIFLAEALASPSQGLGAWEALLSGFFQSVTCRTAGFNTLDISHMTNVSLIVMILLMFIGGSPGSTAGGIKTTTFRAMIGFIVSQIKGRRQTVVGNRALDSDTMNKALTLTIFGMLTVILATLLLSVSEGGDAPHNLARGHFLEVFFEVVSAFGTVGLSVGLTPKLTAFGKIVIICLMFMGRLGPILFLSALQNMQTTPRYQWPEEGVMIG